MPEQNPPFESWAIVEMLGHKKLAGFVSEQTIAGAALIRVDVPATPEDTRSGDAWPATAGYTKLIGVGSVYCLTPCSEEVARRAAREIERMNDPIPVYIPVQRQLVAAATNAAVSDAVAIDDDDDEEDWPAGPWDGEGAADATEATNA